MSRPIPPACGGLQGLVEIIRRSVLRLTLEERAQLRQEIMEQVRKDWFQQVEVTGPIQ